MAEPLALEYIRVAGDAIVNEEQLVTHRLPAPLKLVVEARRRAARHLEGRKIRY